MNAIRGGETVVTSERYDPNKDMESAFRSLSFLQLNTVADLGPPFSLLPSYFSSLTGLRAAHRGAPPSTEPTIDRARLEDLRRVSSILSLEFEPLADFGSPPSGSKRAHRDGADAFAGNDSQSFNGSDPSDGFREEDGCQVESSGGGGGTRGERAGGAVPIISPVQVNNLYCTLDSSATTDGPQPKRASTFRRGPFRSSLRGC